MQRYMLKRDPQYRTVADKIFFKLIGKFPNEDSTHTFIQSHSDEAINELNIVDHLIKNQRNQPL